MRSLHICRPKKHIFLRVQNKRSMYAQAIIRWRDNQVSHEISKDHPQLNEL